MGKQRQSETDHPRFVTWCLKESLSLQQKVHATACFFLCRGFSAV